MTWQCSVVRRFLCNSGKQTLVVDSPQICYKATEREQCVNMNSGDDMENENQHQTEEQEEIPLDETTDALLQAIADAPDDGLDELVQNLPLDVDAFQAFLKASGLEDRPEAKAIIEALTRKKNDGPAP